MLYKVDQHVREALDFLTKISAEYGGLNGSTQHFILRLKRWRVEYSKQPLLSCEQSGTVNG